MRVAWRDFTVWSQTFAVMGGVSKGFEVLLKFALYEPIDNLPVRRDEAHRYVAGCALAVSPFKNFPGCTICPQVEGAWDNNNVFRGLGSNAVPF